MLSPQAHAPYQQSSQGAERRGPSTAPGAGRGAARAFPARSGPAQSVCGGRARRTQTGPAMALGSAWGRVSWLYYQYLLVTALYMLEPWERTVFNSMLVSIVGMALYTGYVFMPQHIMAILHYFEIVQ
ncbi:serine palmitoyltransferase small subunit A [Chelydra serpentina]|uniref:Serine palmitoyltransferase small subunit A n=5 Tax=Testudines TaxID=8459 RepID=A0A8T1T673_CHESE|nr:serine palmitoyltransferase small subunit A [Chelydra serpentina]